MELHFITEHSILRLHAAVSFPWASFQFTSSTCSLLAEKWALMFWDNHISAIHFLNADLTPLPDSLLFFQRVGMISSPETSILNGKITTRAE